MALRLILGFVMILAAQAGAVLMIGGDLLFALDPGYFVMVLAAPLAALAAGPGLRALGQVFRAAASPAGAGAPPVGAPDEGGIRTARPVLRFLAAATLATGVLGFVFNFTWILKDLADRSLLERSIGQGFIPMIYSLLVVAALYLPLLHRIELAGIPEAADAGTPSAKEGRGARRLLGWLLGFAVLVLVVMASYGIFSLYGSFLLFFDTASFCLVVIIPLAMVISGPGLSGLGRAFAAARGGDSSIAELTRAKAVFRYLGLAFLIAAGTGLLLGYAYMLSEYYNRQRVGPCMALMLISLFWSMIGLVGFSLPLGAAAARRLGAASGGE